MYCFTQIKAQKYYQQNLLQVTKVNILILQNLTNIEQYIIGLLIV